ncbi:MAG: ABC transporter substrate-binding protein [Dehalococcoidia bacterium]|nr:ABC transporter substrate-binding protein [Dehalococcoidia bacterium]
MSETTERLGVHLPIDRRTVLRGGTLALGGIAAAALIGCGGDDEETPTATGTAAATGTTTAANKNQNPAQLVKDPNLPYPFGIAEPDKPAKAGGVLNVGVSWDVSTMDPSKSAAGGTITVPNVGYDRLIGFVSGIHYDPLKLELKPELAASWERSPDGLVYTFKIRPGIKWQNVAPLNGRAFVAADAAFALQRYAKEGVHQSIHSEVDKFEAPDAGTLKITLKKPLADYLNNLGGRYQTIFPKELVDDGSIDKTVVGTSSMILRDAKAQQQVTFERNPDYWQGKVNLDGLVFKIMPDGAARIAAFRAGQIEYGYALASKLSDVKNIVGTNPNVQVFMSGGTAGGYGFGMNLQNPKFKDERVRRAISLSMDHDTTIQVIYEGYGVSGPDQPWAFIFPKLPDYKKGELGPWVKAAGDPAQAKQLLDAAGVKDLAINATYYTYAQYDADRPQLLTDQMRKSGITLNARRVEYTEFNSQWVGGKLEEATTSGWSAAGFDADNYFYNQIYSTSPGNRHRLSDPQVDQWADQQRTELDPNKRKDIHKKIWDRIHTDQMYRISQAAGYAYEVQQPWLRGWRGAGGALGSSSYFYDWGEQLIDVWLDK